MLILCTCQLTANEKYFNFQKKFVFIDFLLIQRFICLYTIDFLQDNNVFNQTFQISIIIYVHSIYVCRTTCVTHMAFIAFCLLFATVSTRYSRRNDSQSFTYIQAFVLALRFKNTIVYYYHGIQCDRCIMQDTMTR